MFSFVPGFLLFSLHSRQLLSRRASPFFQILFSPFLYWLSVVFVRLPRCKKSCSDSELHHGLNTSAYPLHVCLLLCVLWGNFMIEKMESKRAVHGNLLCDLLPGCLTKRVVFGQGGRCKALSRLSTGSHWSAKSNDSLAAQNAAHIHIHADVTAVCVNGCTCRHWLK